MTKAQDQRSQSMKEQAYNVDRDKDHKSLTTKAISLISRTSITMNSLWGRLQTPISVNSCIVNGVRFVLHSRDEHRTTQNNGICSPSGKDGEMYYGQLQEILEFSYLSFKVVLFRVKWFDTSNEGRKVKHLVLRNNMTQILTKGEAFKDDQYILATQVKQCFYLEDMARRQPYWKVVEHVNHKKFLDWGVIVVEEDPDVIHFDNSSDLPLFTSLNDLDNTTLHIDDALPYDLADSNDEDLVNVDDDDDVDVVYSNVARGHDGDDRPPPLLIPTGCRGKGTRKPNRGGRKASILDTRRPTRNLGLRSITDKLGPMKIRFEFSDRGTLMPLGDHVAHWSNLLGEIAREFPMHYPAWRKIESERKAGFIGLIRFDLTPHMQSDHWPDIYKGIQQKLAKIYTDNKSALKKEHWVAKPNGTYDVEVIRSRRPANISRADWDAHIRFWLGPKNAARATQNRLNRAKSTIICRQGSRSLAALRDQMSTRKPNRGGRKASRLDTRRPTRNLGLRSITDKSGPVKIRFEFRDRGTLMPLGDHAAHWSNLLGEIVREFPMHYRAWRKIEPEQKARVMGLIRVTSLVRLNPHAIRHLPVHHKASAKLAKFYNFDNMSLEKGHWVVNPKGLDVEVIRSRRPANISQADWDAQIRFWLDPKNASRATQNRLNRAKSTVICRQGSRSLAALRDQMEEMLRLKDLGSNTPSGVPYTDDEINAQVRGGTFPV
ncbi:retrotransposon protein, putative, ty3-gypsy subclass [Tanacetum coccineum]